jgi:two-component system, LytTR family, sensor kinase
MLRRMLLRRTRRLGIKPNSQTKQEAQQARPFFMHPAVFLSGWVALGLLFGFQQLVEVEVSMGDWKIPLWVPLVGDTFGFLLWGLVVLGMWRFLRASIQRASPRQMLLQYLPLSVLVSILLEVIYLAVFRYQAPGKHHTYWTRLERYLSSELVTDIAIFWIGFALVRSIGYYQRFREREQMTARLEAQLVQARMQALQMELNPHFLFNTLNCVSSLMRSDPDSADEMLERLSSLLRITLAKGEAQRIPLQEEMEVIQLYVSIQQLRFGDRVRHSIQVAPEAWDALVPTMILQPIVENAYVHGIARSLGVGTITINASIEGDTLCISIRNAGCVPGSFDEAPKGQGVGIANVKARLELHYGSRQSFSIREMVPGDVTAIFLLPLEIVKSPSKDHAEPLYAASSSDRG